MAGSPSGDTCTYRGTRAPDTGLRARVRFGSGSSWPIKKKYNIRAELFKNLGRIQRDGFIDRGIF